MSSCKRHRAPASSCSRHTDVSCPESKNTSRPQPVRRFRGVTFAVVAQSVVAQDRFRSSLLASGAFARHPGRCCATSFATRPAQQCQNCPSHRPMLFQIAGIQPQRFASCQQSAASRPGCSLAPAAFFQLDSIALHFANLGSFVAIY